jgi:hypothetical protein
MITVINGYDEKRMDGYSNAFVIEDILRRV